MTTAAFVLQTPPGGEDLVVVVARIIALTVLAASLGMAIGLLYRWYTSETVPEGLAVLVGLSGIALYLNTAGALGDVVGGELDLFAETTAIFNVVTFAIGALAAATGGRLGDRVGIGLFAVTGAKTIDGEVSRLVRVLGRVVAVSIPEDVDDIEDIDGYDPVDPAVKTKLAGQTLLFPRGLDEDALRSLFAERLRTDYGVGHVDVDLAADGTVEYLAVGSRQAGIGPTLAPGSAAVAVRADPANAASPGDTVQLWRPGETGPERAVTGELRGTAGDVATIAIDAAEARQLDPDVRYRLVTLPAEPRVDREFAAQLRNASETMGVVTVAEGSSLVGSSVGGLDVAVVAVRTTAGEIEAIPPRDRRLVPGEMVYVIARPDRLRRLEQAAGGTAAASTAADPA